MCVCVCACVYMRLPAHGYIVVLGQRSEVREWEEISQEKCTEGQTSQVVQWLRLCLPVQGLQVQFLVRNATRCGQQFKKKKKWAQGSGCKWPCKELDLDYEAIEGFLSREVMWQISVQFSSVAQSCPTLCDLMSHSTPGLPVHHHLVEFTQTHVPRVSDAIQPSHPWSSPCSPDPNPSQHQSLFQWVNSSHEVAKVVEVQL